MIIIWQPHFSSYGVAVLKIHYWRKYLQNVTSFSVESDFENEIQSEIKVDGERRQLDERRRRELGEAFQFPHGHFPFP